MTSPPIAYGACRYRRKGGREISCDYDGANQIRVMRRRLNITRRGRPRHALAHVYMRFIAVLVERYQGRASRWPRRRRQPATVYRPTAAESLSCRSGWQLGDIRVTGRPASDVENHSAAYTPTCPHTQIAFKSDRSVRRRLVDGHRGLNVRRSLSAILADRRPSPAPYTK